MNDAERLKLRFGPYKTPRFKYGAVVECAVRGDVTITGMTDAPIPWPMGKPPGRSKPTLVVYQDLAKAVQREANVAIRHWWGVGPSTVWKWRKALDVPPVNEGTCQLRSANSKEDWAVEARKKAYAKARDPERCAKIAAARRGRKRPPHVIESMRKANLGRRPSKETRKRMSESHKKRGTRPPIPNPLWSPEEDELVRTLPPKEVVERTGRSLAAVRWRRRVLGVTNRKRKRSSG